MKTKEEAARDYCEKTGSMYFDYTDASNEIHSAFLAGCEWIESQASEGFRKWEQDWYSSGNTYRPKLETAWKAAKLSSQKEIAEKDKEIDKLKSMILSWTKLEEQIKG